MMICSVCSTAVVAKGKPNKEGICEACRRFFKRQIYEKDAGSGLVCETGKMNCMDDVGKSNGNRDKDKGWRFFCKKCRFLKCYEVMKNKREMTKIITKAVELGDTQGIEEDIGNITTEALKRYGEIVKYEHKPFPKDCDSEFFQQVMANFQHCSKANAQFYRYLPGYSSLTFSDRCKLFQMATMSFDLIDGVYSGRIFNTTNEEYIKLTQLFPAFNQLSVSQNDAVVIIGNVKPNPIEVSLLLCLLFYQPLQNKPSGVATQQRCSFLLECCVRKLIGGDEKAASLRIQQIHEMVKALFNIAEQRHQISKVVLPKRQELFEKNDLFKDFLFK